MMLDRSIYYDYFINNMIHTSHIYNYYFAKLNFQY